MIKIIINNVKLYGMTKRFYSRLFQRYVEPTNKFYWKIVHAEILFRIDDLEKRNCSCITFRSELERYKEYFGKININ